MFSTGHVCMWSTDKGTANSSTAVRTNTCIQQHTTSACALAQCSRPVHQAEPLTALRVSDDRRQAGADVHHGPFWAHGEASTDRADGANELGNECARTQQVGDVVAVQVRHDERHARASCLWRPVLDLRAVHRHTHACRMVACCLAARWQPGRTRAGTPARDSSCPRDRRYEAQHVPQFPRTCTAPLSPHTLALTSATANTTSTQL